MRKEKRLLHYCGICMAVPVQFLLRQVEKGRHLAQYTVNLTDKAKKGEIDPVLGRDFEIRQMVDILIRRRQNNPILTGEAGVGKTAVVEGFALRIAEGDVPPPLRGVAIHTLDLALFRPGPALKESLKSDSSK